MLSDEANAVVKSSGTWTNYVQSQGLKPYDLDHIDEAKQIAETSAAYDKAEAEPQQQSK